MKRSVSVSSYINSSNLLTAEMDHLSIPQLNKQAKEVGPHPTGDHHKGKGYGKKGQGA